jgi:Ca2+-binding RTX toxin-like protein
VVAESVNTAVGGIDQVYSSLSHTLGFGLENLVLTGTSVINGTGNDNGNTIQGNGAANYLSGLAGIYKLIGGGGNDTLDGGTGADAMYGNEGDNINYVEDLGDIAEEALAGAAGGLDTVWSTVTYTLGSNVENLRIMGTAAINGTGNDLDNVIQGNGAANTIPGLKGNDVIDGGFGSDLIVGGKGDDELYGSVGQDTLRGEEGNDLLEGGLGVSDVLIGGLGADLFVWTIASSIGDIIRGGDGAIAFEGAGTAAGDLIVLAGIDLDTILPGDQAFVFGGSGPGQLQVVNEGSNSVVLGNMDADAAFEFRLVIEDGAVLASAYTADDFVL